MESTGEAGKIQISESTMKSLTEFGKAHWIRPREELVEAKGKGLLKTHWVVVDQKDGISTTSSFDTLTD